MQVKVGEIKRSVQTSRQGKCIWLTGGAYHIMQSAGNLRRKRRERVEGENEREGRREKDGLAQNEKLLAANNEKDGVKETGQV